MVLPTGAGKSYVIAEIIRRQIAINPSFRCVVLAHRKELVEQNCSEFENIVDDVSRVSVGVYCAALGRREANAQIVFAQINSVYRGDVLQDSFDLIVVDEAHHIPINGAGMYRSFIDAAKKRNPCLRIVGMTATPYRLGEGSVCNPDYVLNEICFEVGVGELIRDGYLCELRSKVSSLAPNLEGVAVCAGDYKHDELSSRVCVQELVDRTITDALGRLNAENRSRCVWFCVDVNHCKMVSEALLGRCERAEFVTGETPPEERSDIVERFRNGCFRHLLNVNVFTEGFNVKDVDAIVLLRPTLSYVLYIQMVGRGLRISQSGADCIVLDYAGCIREHGPIDQKAEEYVPMEICPTCLEYIPRKLDRCPRCGTVISAATKIRHNEEDSRRAQIRRLHGDIAALDDILCRKYGCRRSRAVVNKECLVRYLLLKDGCLKAGGNGKYEIKHNRTPMTVESFGHFLDEFVEYARYKTLTSLPDLLKDYFENDGVHHSEVLRKRREYKKQLIDEIDKAWSDGLDDFDFRKILN